MSTPEKAFSSCSDYGYQWITGTTGDHSCVKHLQQKITKLERDWRIENRILRLPIAGGLVSEDKVEQARNLIIDMP